MKTGLLISFLAIVIFFQNGFTQEVNELDAIHQGKLIIGPRLALGAVYGASIGFGGQMEYGIQDDFIDLGEDIPTWLGLGISFIYSTYSEDHFLFLDNGEFTYTNIVILGTGFWHANVFKHPNLDTYAMVSIGANTGSASYSGNGGNVSTPTVGAFTFGVGIGTRYYLSSKTALVGEVGIGISALRIGADFKL